MTDLSSVMFYRTKFTVASAFGNEDLLWAVVMHVKQWITRKWNKGQKVISTDPRDWTGIKMGSRLFSSDNNVFIESDCFAPFEDSQYWACKITEQPETAPGYAPREWTTEVGFEQTQRGAALFSCVVSYSDRAGFVGPYQAAPSASVPRLISDIAHDQNLRSYFGCDSITDRPQKLYVGDWPTFRSRIDSKERQIPYVYISPCNEKDGNGQPTHLIDPHELAKVLFGNAIVFYSDDIGFSQEVSYMAPEYSCFGGSLRVYQPNVTDAYKHRYLNATEITSLGAEQVCDFLQRAFCRNVHFYDAPFFRIDLCKRKKAEFLRRQRLAELQRAHQEKLSEVEQTTFDIAAEEEEKRLAAESYAEDLEDKIDGLNQTVYKLQSQLDYLKNAAAENLSLKRSLDARLAIEKLPASVEDIMKYFGNAFADRILFSTEAIRSAKDCTIPLDDLWEIFYGLATTMRDLYETGTGDIYSEFYTKTGIKVKRGEGTQTRKDKSLMRQFEISVNGESVDIEAHLTYPKLRQSIHFGYSNRQHVVVVGHCGEHLDNYSTKNVH